MAIDYSKGYRNIYYDARNREMVVWGWDDKGKRRMATQPFDPYLYVESADSDDAISTFGSSLKKIEFNRSADRRRFAEQHRTGRLFYNLTPEQQFAVDNFRHYSTEQLTSMPFRVAFFDIEVNTRRASEGTLIKVRRKKNNIT